MQILNFLNDKIGVIFFWVVTYPVYVWLVCWFFLDRYLKRWLGLDKSSKEKAGDLQEKKGHLCSKCLAANSALAAFDIDEKSKDDNCVTKLKKCCDCGRTDIFIKCDKGDICMECVKKGALKAVDEAMKNKQKEEDV